MEAQYGLEASLFQEIKKFVEGNTWELLWKLLIIQTLTGVIDDIHSQHHETL